MVKGIIDGDELLTMCRRQIEQNDESCIILLKRIIEANNNKIIDTYKFYDAIAMILVDNIKPLQMYSLEKGNTYELIDAPTDARFSYLCDIAEKKRVSLACINKIIKTIAPQGVLIFNTFFAGLTKINEYKDLVWNYLSNNLLECYDNLLLIMFYLDGDMLKEKDLYRVAIKLKKYYNELDETKVEKTFQERLEEITELHKKIELGQAMLYAIFVKGYAKGFKINTKTFKLLLYLDSQGLLLIKNFNPPFNLMQHIIDTTDLSKINIKEILPNVDRKYFLSILNKKDIIDYKIIIPSLNRYIIDTIHYHFYEKLDALWYSVLKKIVESNALYELHPYNIFFVYSTLYKKVENKNTVIDCLIKEMIDKDKLKTDYPYEKLIIALLRDEFYDEALKEAHLKRIIEEKDIDISYMDDFVFIGKEELLYTIISLGSMEVRKALFEKYGKDIPLYVENTNNDTIDKCSVLISIGEFEKAIDTFNDEKFYLIEERKEKQLELTGKIELTNEEMNSTPDYLTKIIESLRRNPNLNVMNSIIFNNKIKFLNCELFSEIYNFYKKHLNTDEFNSKIETIIEHFEKRINDNSLILITIIDGDADNDSFDNTDFTPRDDSDIFDGQNKIIVRLATEKEVDAAFGELSNQRINKYE